MASPDKYYVRTNFNIGLSNRTLPIAVFSYAHVDLAEPSRARRLIERFMRVRPIDLVGGVFAISFDGEECCVTYGPAEELGPSFEYALVVEPRAKAEARLRRDGLGTQNAPVESRAGLARAR